MTDHRAEQYPSLPSVDWSSTRKQRDARRAAMDARNDMIRSGGADVALAATKDGNIGGVKGAKKT